MKDWLCKEYVVKRKRWTIIIDIILESLIVGWLIYYLLFDCSDAIAWFVTEVKERDVVLDTVYILMPIILVTIGMFKFGFYLCNDVESRPMLLNKKQDKETKVTKNTKITKKTKKR